MHLLSSAHHQVATWSAIIQPVYTQLHWNSFISELRAIFDLVKLFKCNLVFEKVGQTFSGLKKLRKGLLRFYSFQDWKQRHAETWIMAGSQLELCHFCIEFLGGADCNWVTIIAWALKKNKKTKCLLLLQLWYWTLQWKCVWERVMENMGMSDRINSTHANTINFDTSTFEHTTVVIWKRTKTIRCSSLTLVFTVLMFCTFPLVCLLLCRLFLLSLNLFFNWNSNSGDHMNLSGQKHNGEELIFISGGHCK